MTAVSFIPVGDLVSLNNGSNFDWAEDQEERNRLWKARHNIWYAMLAIKPGTKVVFLFIYL